MTADNLFLAGTFLSDAVLNTKQQCTNINSWWRIHVMLMTV